MTPRARLALDESAPDLIRLHRALSRLSSVLTVMNTGAHPDDEQSGLLAWLRFGRGIRVIVACSTRGEGGQNVIGPERGAALGHLRTREMEEAARVLDAEIAWLGFGPDDTVHDFGFSKDGDATFARWGEARVVNRLASALRRDRPDMMIPTFLDVPGQHGHHRAMTRAALEAVRLAADPAHEDADGRTPWRVARFYLPAWGGGGGTYDDEVPPPPATVTERATGRDPATGAHWARIGEWSRARHATQGMGYWTERHADAWPLHRVIAAEGRDGERSTTAIEAHPAAAPLSEADRPFDMDEGRLAETRPQTLHDLAALADLAPASGPLRQAAEAADAAQAVFPDRNAVARALIRLDTALAEAEATLTHHVPAAPHRHRLARKRVEAQAALVLAAGVGLAARIDPPRPAPGTTARFEVTVETPLADLPVALSATVEFGPGVTLATASDHAMPRAEDLAASPAAEPKADPAGPQPREPYAATPETGPTPDDRDEPAAPQEGGSQEQRASAFAAEAPAARTTPLEADGNQGSRDPGDAPRPAVPAAPQGSEARALPLAAGRIVTGAEASAARMSSSQPNLGKNARDTDAGPGRHADPVASGRSVAQAIPLHTGRTVTADLAIAADAPFTPAFVGGWSPLGGPIRIAGTIGGHPVAAHLAPEEPFATAPAYPFAADPDVFLLRTGHPAHDLAFRLDLPADAELTAFDPPEGWRVEVAPDGGRILPPASPAAGPVRIAVTMNGRPARARHVAHYPHVGTFVHDEPAGLAVLPLDLTLPEGARIGYVGGGSDRVGVWLRRMGLDVTDLDRIGPATDFSPFTTLVIGVVALATRADLLERIGAVHRFVEAGGTLLTLYQRPDQGWNPDTVPPRRLRIGQPSLRWRVTDPAARITVLAPDHPLLTAPNRIGPEDWNGWDKERGLYFAADWDDVYTPLLAITERGESPLQGALLSARIGKGRHTHCALVLHHQMDRLVPGAFRLMANLVAPAKQP